MASLVTAYGTLYAAARLLFEGELANDLAAAHGKEWRDMASEIADVLVSACTRDSWRRGSPVGASAQPAGWAPVSARGTASRRSGSCGAARRSSPTTASSCGSRHGPGARWNAPGQWPRSGGRTYVLSLKR